MRPWDWAVLGALGALVYRVRFLQSELANLRRYCIEDADG